MDPEVPVAPATAAPVVPEQQVSGDDRWFDGHLTWTGDPASLDPVEGGSVRSSLGVVELRLIPRVEPRNGFVRHDWRLEVRALGPGPARPVGEISDPSLEFVLEVAHDFAQQIDADEALGPRGYARTLDRAALHAARRRSHLR